MTSVRTFHQTTTADEMIEGAMRSVRGEMEPNGLRTSAQEEVAVLSPETMIGWCRDFYSRKFIERRAGSFKPQRCGSWAGASKEFDKFLLGRLDTNWQRLQANGDDKVGVAIIPASFLCPHPDDAQSDAWHKRWDEGGDWTALVEKRCPGAKVFPAIIYEGNDPKSHVQFSLVLLKV